MKEITHHFFTTIPETETRAVELFLETATGLLPDHDPEWLHFTNPKRKMAIYLAKSGQNVVAYALIQEYRKTATIFTGPLVHDSEMISDIYRTIFKHYKQKNFGQLLIYPAEQPEESLRASLPKHRIIDDARNWSTVQLDLTQDLGTIRKNYRSGHKSSVQKARKHDLNVNLLTKPEDVFKLSEIYDQMYSNRGIIKDFDDTKSVFQNLFKASQNTGNTWFLGVFNKNETLLGGIILRLQGETIYYRYGASLRTPENIPVLHLAFDQAIEMSKNKGLKTIDFWGYNRYVSEKSQVGRINYFKTGFGGKVVDYPKAMLFICNPMVHSGISGLKQLRKLWRK